MELNHSRNLAICSLVERQPGLGSQTGYVLKPVEINFQAAKGLRTEIVEITYLEIGVGLLEAGLGQVVTSTDGESADTVDHRSPEALGRLPEPFTDLDASGTSSAGEEE